MSAFFVTNKTINDVVASMCEVEGMHPDPDSLGRALLHMNAEAMRQRYPQIMMTKSERNARSEYEDYISQANAYAVGVGAEPKQRVKSCHCLLYQCSEGDVPEESSLYKRLAAVCEVMDGRYGEGAGEWDRCA